MKKLFTTLVLIAAVIACYSQTTVTRTVQPNLDTLQTTTTVSTVTLKYKPPVKPDTGYHRPKYRASGPLVFTGQTNLLIQLDSINSGLGNTRQIVFNNCNIVHLTKCYFTNTTGYAVTFNNCNNVLMDSCFMGKVAFGVSVNGGSNIQIIRNQGLNRYDVGNTGGQFSHWVQFINVSRGKVSYNRFEDIIGQALHPHDHISIYNSNGAASDSIEVIGNWLRGGQQFAWPSSGAHGVGITIADVSGKYQVVRGNILVNTGYEGIIFVSSGNYVKIDHNKIYGAPIGISLTGIAVIGANKIDISYNQVKWYKSTGALYSSWVSSGSPLPLNWGTNNFNANIDASILPTKLITWQ